MSDVMIEKIVEKSIIEYEYARAQNREKSNSVS